MKVVRKAAARVAVPILRRAARAYIAGPELADALRVVDRVKHRGFATTLGFWDGEDDSPRWVADAYIAALQSIPRHDPDSYLSIKLPALAYSTDLLDEVREEARKSGARIHFDSLGPDTVDRTWNVIEQLQRSSDSPVRLSVSLPGRWRRSLRDAEWATELGVGIRVVKGQWEDESQLDPHRGFLSLVQHASLRGPLAVATHDPHLASESLHLIQASDAKTEFELLFGLPSRRVLQLARETNTPVRIYVPYGHAWLPYCMEQAQKNPRVFWWMLKDSLLARGSSL